MIRIFLAIQIIFMILNPYEKIVKFFHQFIRRFTSSGILEKNNYYHSITMNNHIILIYVSSLFEQRSSVSFLLR